MRFILFTAIGMWVSLLIAVLWGACTVETHRKHVIQRYNALPKVTYVDALSDKLVKSHHASPIDGVVLKSQSSILYYNDGKYGLYRMGKGNVDTTRWAPGSIIYVKAGLRWGHQSFIIDGKGLIQPLWQGTGACTDTQGFVTLLSEDGQKDNRQNHD